MRHARFSVRSASANPSIGPASSPGVRSPTSRRRSAISSADRGGRPTPRSRPSTRPIASGSRNSRRDDGSRSGSRSASSTIGPDRSLAARTGFVPLVKELQREPEDQLRRERRRHGPLVRGDPDRARSNGVEERPQPGQVEVLIKTFTISLDDDREIGNRLTACKRSFARSRCSHSGVRLPGSGRGIRRARPAFCRNRRPNQGAIGKLRANEVEATSAVNPAKTSIGGSSDPGRRNRIPSSPCSAATSIPRRSRNAPRSPASAHGAADSRTA